MNILSDLFFSFIKIGLFTFGGGYAMIATTAVVLPAFIIILLGMVVYGI